MEDKKWSLNLIFVSVILSLGLMISSGFASYSFLKSKNPSSGVITVVGSAKQQVKSDFAVWRCRYFVQTNALPESYRLLKSSQATVKNYLISKGISESDLNILAVETQTIYVRNANGMESNQIEGYRLAQSIEIKSNDVDKIFSISKEATELIDKGVQIESQLPQFYYTKIADLKINVLALATKDARDRADKVAENTGSKVVAMKSSKMGVFQIRPLYSDEISDYGINDTTSIDKEIMAVMNCEFKTK
jgi:hypothetical protein